MTTESKKKGRACGYCDLTTKPAHNARTCPKRKADGANGAHPEQPPSTPPVTNAATASSPTPPPAVPEPLPSTLDVSEFEEVRKQLHVGSKDSGVTMMIAAREYEAGFTKFVWRMQPDSKDIPVREFSFTIEEAETLYALFGWGLQRNAVRKQVRQLPVARSKTLEFPKNVENVTTTPT